MSPEPVTNAKAVDESKQETECRAKCLIVRKSLQATYSSIIFEPIYLRSSYDSHEKKTFARAQMETETTEMKTSEAYQRGWLG